MQTKSERIWIHDGNAKESVNVGGKIINLSSLVFPQDESLERLVIGHLIALGDMGDAQDAFKYISRFLYHDDFYFRKSSIIYEAMVRIVRRGDAIDTQSVITELRKRQGSRTNALVYVGGEKAIYALADVIPQNTETHAREITRLSLRRSGILLGHSLRILGQQDDSELSVLAGRLHQAYRDFNARLSTLVSHSGTDVEGSMPDLLEQVEEEALNPDHEVGIPIWIEGLNERLLGWRKNRLYIVGAGTGIGKTAFMLSAALEALKAGKKVLFISLEMTYKELLERVISMGSGINNQRLQRRTLNPVELTRLRAFEEEMMSYFETGGMYVEELNNPSMYDIEARLDVYRHHGIDLVFIDYVGTEMIKYATADASGYAARYPGSTEHANSLWSEMRRLKLEHPYPFIVGAQVNRSYMNRQEQTPE